MHKYNNKLLPDYFNMFVETNEQKHHQDNRGKSNIHLICHNIKTRSFSIRDKYALLWNSLDSSIKQWKSLNSFKNTFKHHL